MEIGKLIATVAIVVAVFYSVQGATAKSCMHKLEPCEPYMHKLDPPPPPSCCKPMKKIVEKQGSCLCTIFTNPVMLNSLNLTKENALDLPKACGLNPDISHCDNGSKIHRNRSARTISFNGLGFLTALVAITMILF